MGNACLAKAIDWRACRLVKLAVLQVQIAQFFQLAHEPMSKRAFRTQLIQQIFALNKSLGGDVAFEEPLPATRDFLFS